MGFIAWIVVGAIAGYLASQLMSSGQSLLMMVVLGIVVGLIGGFVATALNLGSVNGINIESIVIATLGAVAILFVTGRSPAASWADGSLCATTRAEIAAGPPCRRRNSGGPT